MESTDTREGLVGKAERPSGLSEDTQELLRDGCPSTPLIAGALSTDRRLSFASMSDCMVIGISGGCGLRCPVLHAGRCETEDDFRADAVRVLSELRARALSTQEPARVQD